MRVVSLLFFPVLSVALRAQPQTHVALSPENKVLDTVIQPSQKRTTFLEDMVRFWSDDKSEAQKSAPKKTARNEVGVTYIDDKFEAVVDESFSEDDYASDLLDGLSKIAQGTKTGLSILAKKAGEGLTVVAKNVAEGSKVLMEKASQQYEAYKTEQDRAAVVEEEKKLMEKKDTLLQITKKEVQTTDPQESEEDATAPDSTVEDEKDEIEESGTISAQPSTATSNEIKVHDAVKENFRDVRHKMKRFEKDDDDAEVVQEGLDSVAFKDLLELKHKEEEEEERADEKIEKVVVVNDENERVRGESVSGEVKGEKRVNRQPELLKKRDVTALLKQREVKKDSIDEESEQQ